MSEKIGHFFSQMHNIVIIDYIYTEGFLRKNLAYDSPTFYYTCIVLDLPLRFTWVLSISPNLANILGIWP